MVCLILLYVLAKCVVFCDPFWERAKALASLRGIRRWVFLHLCWGAWVGKSIVFHLRQICLTNGSLFVAITA